MNQNQNFSFLKGYSFSFNVDNHQIDAWFSSLSGMEKIFVDGKLISSQRSLSFDSSHIVNIDGSEYSVDLKVTSILKGPVTCTLIKNGSPYRRKTLVFPAMEKYKTGLAKRIYGFIAFVFILSLINI